MKPIGGYFELELSKRNLSFLHSECRALNSGRHALEYILSQLDVKRIYLPFYTCDVVLEPIKRLQIGYQFYHIDENLEIAEMPSLGDSEYIIVNNYFGIKDSYVKTLCSQIGERLIIDNAQAFYAPEFLGTNTIYSPRKYVGVPDGGFAYVSNDNNIELEQDCSTDRSGFLLRRIDSGASSGYREFKESALTLKDSTMKNMSSLTYRLMQSIDFSEIKRVRRRNFAHLHKVLSKSNLLDIPEESSFECPMVYPYRTSDITLRKRLIENQIFVATYWPNVSNWCSKNDMEYQLMSEIIPLPIDQRYDISDMNRIIKTIIEYGK